MSKFKVGDIVRGTDAFRYNITNTKMTEGVVTKVTPLDEEDIMVRIINHKEGVNFPFADFPVQSQYFELVQLGVIEEEKLNEDK